jgi:hypothetical protein
VPSDWGRFPPSTPEVEEPRVGAGAHGLRTTNRFSEWEWEWEWATVHLANRSGEFTMSVGAARPYRHRRGKRYRTRCRPGRLRNSPRPEIVNASPPSGVRHGSFDAHGRPPHKLMRDSIVTPSGLTSRRLPERNGTDAPSQHHR